MSKSKSPTSKKYLLAVILTVLGAPILTVIMGWPLGVIVAGILFVVWLCIFEVWRRELAKESKARAQAQAQAVHLKHRQASRSQVIALQAVDDRRIAQIREEQMLRALAERAEIEKERRQIIAREQQRVYEEKRFRILRLSESIERVCKESADLLEVMSESAIQSLMHLKSARRHFDAGAYSPFWGAIEDVYVQVNNFNTAVEKYIGANIAYHKTANEVLALDGSSITPAFPMSDDVENYFDDCKKVLSTTASIVYEAQRDAVFSLIWEQRRTIASIELGFANLEQAISTSAQSVKASQERFLEVFLGKHSNINDNKGRENG